MSRRRRHYNKYGEYTGHSESSDGDGTVEGLVTIGLIAVAAIACFPLVAIYLVIDACRKK